MTSLVLQITPTYPPAAGGVGDYSALLGAAVLQLGLPIRTLVGSPGPAGNEVLALAGRSASELLAAIEASGTRAVLLHFSGYGYGARGLCHWLIDGLARWKDQDPSRRLVTIFHEVYATGPIWRSSFWTALPQMIIARRLARLSDHAWVTSEAALAQLRKLMPSITAEVVPVYSNVGELAQPGPLVARDPIAVAFGSWPRKVPLYAALEAPGSRTALKRLNITEIIDIGPPGDSPGQVGEIPVRQVGNLTAEEVSRLLSRARVGLVHYPLNVLTKSGISAAYFAHGLLVVNACDRGRPPSDLSSGRQFLSSSSAVPGPEEQQAVATRGAEWYRAHSRSVVASKLLKLFE